MPDHQEPDSTASLQRRTLVLLSLAQIFSGIGTGAVLATGSLLAVELSGQEALAGSVTTATTLGAALGAALLMRLAVSRGRRLALSTGLLVATVGVAAVVIAAITVTFWLLIVGGALIGFAGAANLQARFAATDLSRPSRRGRDLSIVVWMSTVGAVAGPNLIGVGEEVAGRIGIPALAGLFVIALVGMIVGAAIIWLGLRPDPAHVAAERASAASGADGSAVPARGLRRGMRALWVNPQARAGLIGITAAHAVMVAVMSMTPVHLTTHGASVSIVGVTVSLHIAGMYVLAPVMGLLTDRLGGRAVMLGGLATLFAAALLAGFSGDAHAATLVGLILLGVGWSAATVAGSATIVDGTPLTERVAAQGASDMLMSLAGGGGGLLAGVLLAVAGYPGVGVVAAAIILLAVIPLLRGRARS